MRMELHTGVCGICSCKNLVLNSKDSEKYHNLICSHFENEFIIPKESEHTFNLCTTCIYHITLINTKKDYFLHRNENEELESSEKCALCKEASEVFSTADSDFLNKCKPWISGEKGALLCSSCFFLIEIRYTLKNFLLAKLSDKDDQKNCTPKQRGPLSRRKSLHETRKNSKVDPKASTSHEKAEESSSNNLIDSSTTYDVNSTPIQSKKRRRSKNLEELLNEESKNLKEGIRSVEVYTKNELTGYNLSNILNISPLSKSNVNIKDEYKRDEKMYNFIPFVKMNLLENRSTESDQCNYVCSLVPQRPMIRVRRTPPIKIKSIKNVFPLKEKKSTKDKMKPVSTSKEELPKYKLIVRLERMKLPKGETLEAICEIENNISEKVATPKKKKRVHFNDTPTIIITEDDYEQRNQCDESKNKNIRSIMVGEQRKVYDVEMTDENDQNIDESDSEELITLTLDSGSDDVEDPQNVEEMVENSKENDEEPTRENLELDCNIQVDNGNNEDINKVDNCTEEEIEKENSGSGDENNEDTNNESDNCNDQKRDEGLDEERGAVNSEENIEDINNKEDNSNNQIEKDGLEEQSIHNSSSETIIVDSSEKFRTHGTSSSSQGTEDEHYKEVLTQIEELEEALIKDDTDKDEAVEEQSSDHNEGDEEAKDDLEAEKDSLDGFEVIDEENGERSLQETDEIDPDEDDRKDSEPEVDTVKNNLNNELRVVNNFLDDEKTEAKDSWNEIDLLVNKYCEEDSNKEPVENEELEDESTTNQNEEEIETVDGEETIPQENTNGDPVSEGKNETEQTEEDFGSLIDEVQKCLLTSTKEILDNAENAETQKSPNTSKLLDILNSSFNETESPPKENINGDKNLKRKNSDEVDTSDHKRVKMENS